MEGSIPLHARAIASLGVVCTHNTRGVGGADEVRFCELELAAIGLMTAIDASRASQGGTSENEQAESGALTSDGSAVYVGHTDGDWNGTNSGGTDFIVGIISNDGQELRRWQVRSDGLLVVSGREHLWCRMGTGSSTHSTRVGDFSDGVLRRPISLSSSTLITASDLSVFRRPGWDGWKRHCAVHQCWRR